MFKKFLVALAMVASSCAFSATIETSGLTDAQVAALKASAAKAAADNANANAGVQPGQVLSMAATWGTQASTAAEGFAKAINIAARELGVTVNDFIKTDAGKLTVALIVWKVAGSAIAHLLYGILFFIVGMSIVRLVYHRLFTKNFEKVEYSHFGGLFKGTKNVRVPKSIVDFKTEGEWLAFWVMIIISVLTLGITGAIVT